MMASSKQESKKSEKKPNTEPTDRNKLKSNSPNLKLFGRWSSIEYNGSMRGYINLDDRLLPRSEGALRGRFHKSKVHIVERLALKLMVSGHTGKRHRITSGRFTGKFINALTAVEKALEIMEKRTNKNPLEILVHAIENAALREEVISYQLGSIMAREAVVTSPQRRVDKTLRFFAQSAYRKSFRNKKALETALAEEILAAYKSSNDSFAIKEKERIEREASGAR